MINQPTITADSSRIDIIYSILQMVYVKHPCMDYVYNIEEALPYMSKEDLLETHEKILKIYMSTDKTNKAEE
jgi:hypothetical protein